MAVTIPTGVVTFANQPSCTVTTGGTAALSQGASEAWTVSSGTTFPVASTSTTPATMFMVADTASTSEIICVTAATTVSPWVWNVTRGAESTTPVTHATNFIVQQVVTAGALANFKQATNSSATAITVSNSTAETVIASYDPQIGDVAAGATYDLIAYGPFATGTRYLGIHWRIRWGGLTGPILCQIGSSSPQNAPSITVTTVAAGAAYDINGTVTLDSSTTASANLNWWYNTAANLVTTSANAQSTNTNSSNGQSTSTPISISGNGPLVLTVQLATASAANRVTAICPIIYRQA